MLPIKALAIHLTVSYIITTCIIVTLMIPILVTCEKWSINRNQVSFHAKTRSNSDVDDFNHMLRQEEFARVKSIYFGWVPYVKQY